MESSSAEFIWTDQPPSRNATALFRYTFSLETPPEQAFLNLFADTRYRLVVNGVTVCHGPARFKREHPEFDTVDLLPFLAEGENVLAIAVNSLARGTFLTDPGCGGLLAFGRVTESGGREVEILSGDGWKALPSPAHEPLMNELSFAVGPGEWLDLRKLPAGWETTGFDDRSWPTATRIEDQWGDPSPRSIPPLDEREVTFDSQHNAYASKSEAPYDQYCGLLDSIRRETNHHLALGFLHSPKAQEVLVTNAGGDFHLNGEKLNREPRGEAPARTEYRASFRKGWNSVLLVTTVRTDLWEFALRIPSAAGIAVHQNASPTGRKGFLFLGPLEQRPNALIRQIEQEGTAFKPDPQEWKPVPRARQKLLPAQERAWDRFHVVPELRQRAMLQNPNLLRNLPEAYDAVTLLFDFGREVLGRPLIELTAPAGTVIDLTYSERLHDGKSDPGYQGTRMAERFITKRGHQIFHAMHPRGMRYLEVIIRRPPKALEFHRVGITRALYPVESTGRFRCSDPKLERIWELGQVTQAVCMEDAYLDCPWRERGIYTGDLLVEYYTNLACFGDHALMRRSTALMFQTQGENLLLAPCSHGLPAGRHPDYSGIAIIALWHYWARSGDLSLAREQQEVVAGVLRGLRQLEAEGLPLIDGEHLHPYLDNARVERGGINFPLNAILYEAHRKGAELFALLGDGQRAEETERHAKRMRTALRKLFFDSGCGLFLDRRPQDGSEVANPSAVGNILALLFEVADRRQTPAILDFVEARMLNNFGGQNPTRTRDYHVSPYFSYFALEVLYRHGRADSALRYMRRFWSYMLRRGAWSCWEFFSQTCSLCHAWSSAPTHYLSTRVLGIEYAEPGNPNRIRINPHATGLRWAEGVYPHPDGPIELRWEKKGEVIHLDYSAPETVELVLGNDDKRIA